MSIDRSVQDQKHGQHVKKYEKEDEHDGPAGTHDTRAHRESEGTECQNYDSAMSKHHDQDGRDDGAR